jgi:hypothetical protein
MKMMSIISAMVLTASSAALANPGEPVPAGVWGGPGLNMTVHDQTMTVQFGCAHGFLARPLADRQDRFETDGYLQTDLVMRNRPQIPTHVVGYMVGNQMRVTFDEQGQQPVTYTLTHDHQEQMAYCR